MNLTINFFGVIMILTVEIRKAKIKQLSQEIDIFWEELRKFVDDDLLDHNTQTGYWINYNVGEYYEYHTL